MRIVVVLIVSAAINSPTTPAIASECTTSRDIDAFRSHWAALRSESAKVVDRDRSCRAYAASFYESVTLRQAATKCVEGARSLAVLDSEINAFNDLLATKCGG